MVGKGNFSGGKNAAHSVGGFGTPRKNPSATMSLRSERPQDAFRDH